MKNYLQFLEFRVVVGFWVFLLLLFSVYFFWKIFHLLSSQILSLLEETQPELKIKITIWKKKKQMSFNTFFLDHRVL